jgi:hypothetical protein
MADITSWVTEEMSVCLENNSKEKEERNENRRDKIHTCATHHMLSSSPLLYQLVSTSYRTI